MKLSQVLACAAHVQLVHAYDHLKLQHWLPQYKKHWVGSALTPECASRLNEYWTNNRSRCHSPCACAADCLLRNVTSTMQSSFASAQVIFGLVPSVMIFIGPSIAETAVLSSSKPVLAGLLALEAPAINVMRLFSQVDVREPLERDTTRSMTMILEWRSRQSTLIRMASQGLGFIVAFAAIANNTQNSVYLDLRTISGWKCSTLYLPLAWSLGCILVHVPSMIAVRRRLKNGPSRTKAPATPPMSVPQTGSGEDTILSEILFGLASVFAIGHLIFGIMELSSLVFISAQEALQVFGRYVMSVFACQFILVMELTEMRRNL